MCGIFGVVYADGGREPSEELLRRSAGLIAHRGPDGSGIYSEPGVGLAHTRLALVDLDERSDQPLWDPERRYCVVYNGEIYNFRELREELIGRGVRFRTTSDTEVLLQCLILDGPDRTLPRLQGMFAFAFYDKLERRLLLARDRFGIKPLLVYQDEEKFLFASEVKAMQPWIDLRPNVLRLISYLIGVTQPTRNKGFFESIEILPPGSVVKLDVGASPTTEKYMDLTDMIDRARSEELEGLTKEQIVDRVDELLQRSVKQMLVADAPVGALCSGGVDSSLIMAMAARHHQDLAIFHANIVGPLSEYEAAARLAKHLKLDLLTVEAHDHDFIEMTADVLYHYEQPFSLHPQSVAVLMLSKLVQKSGVKGVLTGEGSDECFLGYGKIAQERIWDFYDRQVKRLERLVLALPKVGHHLWSTKGQVAVLIGDMLGQFEETSNKQHARMQFARRMQRPPDRNVRTLDLLSETIRTLMHRNDTMGMAASIEARFPYLDEELVATAVNLPYRYKVRFSPGVWEKEHPFFRDKWVLRRVADRYLPKHLSQRKKLAFPASAFDRMRIPKEFFRGSFVSDYFKLSNDEFDILYETENQALEVRLMMLEAWAQIFIEGVEPDSVRQRLCQHAHY